MKLCEGRVALITGASAGGTGTAIAIRLAAEGAKVAITARSESGLVDTLNRIEELGGEGLVLPCDLGDPNGRRDTLISQTEDYFGQPVDILVNNAFSDANRPLHEWTLSDLRHHAEVNLFGPWIMMTQVIPAMKERKQGWILNLSSFCAEIPPLTSHKAYDGRSVYGSMKAAINRMTVQGAAELLGSGVAMNTLAPQRSILVPRESKLVKDKNVKEPVETMAEAALALVTGDPDILTGRLAYSLQLLLELQRPVYQLDGKNLLEGWQPQDLIEQIRYREDQTAINGWPDPFEFHRPHTPYPEALRR